MARCLFSRTWALRDAAVLKARLLVQDAASGGLECDIGEALPALSDVLALGLDDKIAQVFMTSLALLEALLGAAKAARLKRSQVGRPAAAGGTGGRIPPPEAFFTCPRLPMPSLSSPVHAVLMPCRAVQPLALSVVEACRAIDGLGSHF